MTSTISDFEIVNVESLEDILPIDSGSTEPKSADQNTATATEDCVAKQLRVAGEGEEIKASAGEPHYTVDPVIKLIVDDRSRQEAIATQNEFIPNQQPRLSICTDIVKQFSPEDINTTSSLISIPHSFFSAFSSQGFSPSVNVPASPDMPATSITSQVSPRTLHVKHVPVPVPVTTTNCVHEHLMSDLLPACFTSHDGGLCNGHEHRPSLAINNDYVLTEDPAIFLSHIQSAVKTLSNRMPDLHNLCNHYERLYTDYTDLEDENFRQEDALRVDEGIIQHLEWTKEEYESKIHELKGKLRDARMREGQWKMRRDEVSRQVEDDNVELHHQVRALKNELTEQLAEWRVREENLMMEEEKMRISHMNCEEELRGNRGRYEGVIHKLNQDLTIFRTELEDRKVAYDRTLRTWEEKRASWGRTKEDMHAELEREKAQWEAEMVRMKRKQAEEIEAEVEERMHEFRRQAMDDRERMMRDVEMDKNRKVAQMENDQQEKNNFWKKQNNGLQKELHHLKNMAQDYEQLHDEFLEYKAEKEDTINDLRSKLGRQHRANTELEKGHEEQIQRLRREGTEELDKQINIICRDQRKATTSLKEQNDKEVERLRVELDEKLHSQSIIYNDNIRRLQKQHADVIDETRKHSEKIAQDLQVVEATSTEKSEMLADLQRQLNITRAESASRVEEYRSAEQRYEVEREKWAQGYEAFQSLQTVCDAKQMEIETLEMKVCEFENKEHERVGERENLDNTINELREKSDRLSASLEAEKKDWEINMSNLTSERDAFQLALQDANDSIAIVRLEKQNLQDRLDKFDEERTEVGISNIHKAEKQQELEDQVAEMIKESEELLDDFQNLDVEHNQLKGDHTTKLAEYEKLKMQHDGLVEELGVAKQQQQQQQEDANRHAREVDQLKASLVDLRAKNADLQLKVDSWRKKESDLKNEIRALETKNEMAHKDHATSLRHLRRKNESNEQEKSTWEGEKGAMEKKYRDLTDKQSELLDEVMRLKSELGDLQDKEQQHEIVQEKLDTSESQRRAQRLHERALEEEIDKLKARLEDETAKMTSMSEPSTRQNSKLQLESFSFPDGHSGVNMPGAWKAGTWQGFGGGAMSLRRGPPVPPRLRYNANNTTIGAMRDLHNSKVRDDE